MKGLFTRNYRAPLYICRKSIKTYLDETDEELLVVLPKENSTFGQLSRNHICTYVLHFHFFAFLLASPALSLSLSLSLSLFVVGLYSFV